MYYRISLWWGCSWSSVDSGVCHDTVNMTICLVIPSTQSAGGELGRMAGCIPSNLIDIQAPLRTPAENFARCYNYFSNLEFMRMFYCSVISRLLIYRQGSFNPSGHPFISSLNPFKSKLLSCNFSRIFRCQKLNTNCFNNFPRVATGLI